MQNASSPAPDRRRRITTSDFDEAHAGLRGLYGEIAFDIRGAFTWTADVADLGPLAIIRGTCTTPFVLDGTPAAHVLHLASTDGVRVLARGDEVEEVPGQVGACISPGTRVSMHAPTAIRTLTVRVDSRFLAAQLEALSGGTVQRPISFALALRTEGGPAAYAVRLLQFMAAEVERGTPFDEPVVVTGVLESIARNLLIGQPHDHAHLLERPAPPSGRTVVRIVEEYLDAHAAGPVPMADLAAHTGASLRAIEAAFLQHRGTTPAAFLRARRLAAARDTLLANAAASLGRIAAAAGFTRIASFEAAYVQAFHEPSAETRARGRALLGAPPPPSSEDDNRLALLSTRELEVCMRVVEGMLNKQIAADLGIAEATVKKHRATAMTKLGTPKIAALIRMLDRHAAAR